ncbi:MAG: hypothetical protein ACFE9L_01190 [Candidatus Hodarchaeota archaeon]
MPRILNVKLNAFLVFLIATILMFPLLATADQTPIIFVEDERENYSPGTYNDWDYYILPPGTDYRLDTIEYWGTDTDGYYTINDGNTFGISQPRALTRGDEVTRAEFLQNDLRLNDSHPFFDSIPYPRAVRIDSAEKPVFTRVQKQALSLHMDYASTFIAEKDVLYWGFLNSSDPFFIDISLSGTAVEADFWVEASFPGYYLTGVPETKMTYPVFPLNENMSIRRFYLQPNVTTIVTLTPHPWEFPDWLPILEPNTVFTGEFEQGEPWVLDAETDRMIKPDNTMFSIRMFNLSLVKDEYYRIATVFDMEDVKPGVPSALPEVFLMGEHYKPILGAFKPDGYLDIFAQESENATLVLYSSGEAHGQYFIAFQEKAAPVILTEIGPLTLNTNITVEIFVNYTFTLSTPTMMRVNWTVGSNFDYEVYVEGSEQGKWIFRTTESFFPSNTWRYLPAGNYAIVFTNIEDPTDEIQFNSLEIQSPTTSSPFNIENDTMLAIELPLTRNRINFVNISTTDQKNQTVYYDWFIVSKYNEFFTQGGLLGNNEGVGNRQTATGWEAYPSNNTRIVELLPTRDYEVPILIIWPDYAEDTTGAPTTLTDGFSATLRITTNEAVDQSYTVWSDFYVLNDGFPTGTYDLEGVFIPTSAISSTNTFIVNDSKTLDNDQVFGIPLSLTPSRIYNITVYLIGNYSTIDPIPTNYLNATFNNELYVHGGNFRSLEIFNTQTSERYDNTSTWISLLILTVSDTSYLYLDLRRTDVGPGWGNATLQVSISEVPITNMEFLIEYEYNHTVSDQEVFTKELLATEIKPPEMQKTTTRFPLELLLIAGGGVVVVAAIAGAIVYIRGRRSSI